MRGANERRWTLSEEAKKKEKTKEEEEEEEEEKMMSMNILVRNLVNTQENERGRWPKS